MPRTSDRKTEILKRAARVFFEHGYDATSMSEVAKSAEVTKPGLYYHFESKQELLFAILSQIMDTLERATLEATLGATDSLERLRRIIAAHARIMVTEEQDGAFTVLVIDEMQGLAAEDRRLITHRKRKYYEVVRGVLEQLRKEGRLRDIDPKLAAFSLLGMVLWISKWFDPAGPLSGEEVVEQITDMAVAAVVVPAQGSE